MQPYSFNIEQYVMVKNAKENCMIKNKIPVRSSFLPICQA